MISYFFDKRHSTVGNILKSDVLLFFLLFLFFLCSLWNLTFNTSTSYGEIFEDILRYQYQIESIMNNNLPLWQPFSDNGRPFTFYSLIMGYISPLDLLFAFILKIVSFFMEFNIHHAIKILLIVYTTLFTMGLYKLYGVFIAPTDSLHKEFTLSKTVSLAMALITIFVIFLKASFGLNTLYILLQIYPVFCFYYLYKYCVCDTSWKTFLKLGISYSLMFYTSGAYTVPFTLMLFSFLFFLFLAPKAQNVVYTIAEQGRNRDKGIQRQLLGIVAIVFLVVIAILPIMYSYLTDLSQIVRQGKDLEHLDFAVLIKTVKWHIFRYIFDYFMAHKTPYYGIPIITFYFFIVGWFDKSFFKKNYPLYLLFLFILSVALKGNSPFLILFYKILFPFIAKITYIGVYFDFLFIFYMIFVVAGVKNFITKQSIITELIFFCFYAYSIHLYRHDLLLPESIFRVSLFFPLNMILLKNITYVNKRKFGYCIVTLLLGVQLAEYMIHVKPSFNDMKSQHEGALALIFNRSSSDVFNKYEFQEYRTPRKYKNYEKSGYGISPILRRIEFITDNRWMSFLHQAKLNDILNEKQKRKYFAIKEKIVRLSDDISYTHSLEETAAELEKNLLQDVILVDSQEQFNINPPQGKRPNMDSPDDNSKNIEILEYNPNLLSIEVASDGPKFLIFSDTHYKGWKAWIDGEETKIYRANLNFKAVFLPAAGDYTIKFQFTPLFRYLYIVMAIVIWSMIITAVVVKDEKIVRVLSNQFQVIKNAIQQR